MVVGDPATRLLPLSLMMIHKGADDMLRGIPNNAEGIYSAGTHTSVSVRVTPSSDWNRSSKTFDKVTISPASIEAMMSQCPVTALTSFTLLILLSSLNMFLTLPGAIFISTYAFMILVPSFTTLVRMSLDCKGFSEFVGEYVIGFSDFYSLIVYFVG